MEHININSTQHILIIQFETERSDDLKENIIGKINNFCPDLNVLISSADAKISLITLDQNNPEFR